MFCFIYLFFIFCAWIGAGQNIVSTILKKLWEIMRILPQCRLVLFFFWLNKKMGSSVWAHWPYAMCWQMGNTTCITQVLLWLSLKLLLFRCWDKNSYRKTMSCMCGMQACLLGFKNLPFPMRKKYGRTRCIYYCVHIWLFWTVSIK